MTNPHYPYHSDSLSTRTPVRSIAVWAILPETVIQNGGRKMDFSNGMNLRDALKLARLLGLSVRYADRTGEWLIRGPDRFVRHNARRKDASRALVCLLRRTGRGPGSRIVSTNRDSN